jgi:hypothetical protein
VVVLWLLYPGFGTRAMMMRTFVRNSKLGCHKGEWPRIVGIPWIPHSLFCLSPGGHSLYSHTTAHYSSTTLVRPRSAHFTPTRQTIITDRSCIVPTIQHSYILVLSNHERSHERLFPFIKNQPNKVWRRRCSPAAVVLLCSF